MYRTGIACITCASSLAVLLAVPAVSAESFPERPIRMIVPFAPGGGTDINARILADPLSKVLGQTVVVDNRPGAGSIIGTDLAAKATPDGYTILLGTSSLAVNYAVYKRLPYDARRDFSPISQVSDQPNMMVVNPSLPANSLKELISLVQSQPGKFTFGSPGTGTATHLASVLLISRFNGEMIHVPYKGTGPALTALISGEISVYLSTFASALPHVKNGRLRALAVTGAKRSGPLPDVPTVSQAGVPGYVHLTWYGMLAPRGTPPAVVAKLNKAVVGVLKSDQVSKLYDAQGLNPVPTTPAEFAKKIDEESRKWVEVVRANKIPRRSLGGF
jgi:tripartite-type tricarboxylate transporter receptor subunit TctC